MTGSGSVKPIQQNIALTAKLLEEGQAPEILGTVSGSAAARHFWQKQLDLAREGFRARRAISFHEDLPTNQAFGILLLWQRLREEIRGMRGALVAFVFGEGTRSSPFTEADCAQKPAMATFVPARAARGIRYLSMVELSLRYFVPVERYLERSGFKGLVVKWGDEVQIPALDLSGRNALFADADVVRFVSLKAMSEDNALNKDWVGVDARGYITAFIPRRPLEQMEKLAGRGLIRRQGGRLFGGINLGSVALSSALLELLLEEFRCEVNDPGADRAQRPDLDPQFFTALTIAALEDPEARRFAWILAREGSEAIRKLENNLPGLLGRLRGVLERFEEMHRRRVKMVALDFGEQYWGDIGQHTKIFEFFMALNDSGSTGEVARAIAGISGPRDENGNILAGETEVHTGVTVKNSVLINATLTGKGAVEKSVLIGTRAGNIQAREAFDVLSIADRLILEPRGGTYKVVSRDLVRAGPGERLTTLFLPGKELLFRVLEQTDLRDRKANYDRPILGNPLSFRDAHEAMGRVAPEELAARREGREREVLEKIGIL